MPQPMSKATAASLVAVALPVADHEPLGIAAIGGSAIEWTESPAKLLHARLVATFAAPPTHGSNGSLSPRVKLAILVGSSAILWMIIGLAVATII